jgi:hypothetical protein
MRSLSGLAAALMLAGTLVVGYGTAAVTNPVPALAKVAARPHAKVRAATKKGGEANESGASLKGVKTKAKLTLTIVTGAMIHRPGWPKYLADGKSSATIRLPAHALVTVVLKSYDTGSSPPPAHFASVDGTVGDVVRVDGKAVKAVPAKDIAHTFTVIGLDLNVPVPVVPKGQKFVTETFQFVTGKAGTYSWQCYAPCGTGNTGWDGAMITPGYMMGNIDVF